MRATYAFNSSDNALALAESSASQRSGSATTASGSTGGDVGSGAKNGRCPVPPPFPFGPPPGGPPGGGPPSPPKPPAPPPKPPNPPRPLLRLRAGLYAEDDCELVAPGPNRAV